MFKPHLTTNKTFYSTYHYFIRTPLKFRYLNNMVFDFKTIYVKMEYKNVNISTNK